MGAQPPFIYVLKQKLKVQYVGGKQSRFRIEAHRILMRDEEYGDVKRYFDHLEEVNKSLQLPVIYEIHKEGYSFGDGTYE